MDIRDCLKLAVANSGMKQIAIAERANIAPDKLSNILNKRRKLEASEMIEICSILGISVAELLQFKNGLAKDKAS